MMAMRQDSMWVSPAEQVGYWRAKRSDRHAEGWDLPGEVGSQLQGFAVKGDALNGYTQPLEANRREVMEKAYLLVERAIIRAFARHRGHAWRAAGEFLFHGVSSTGARFTEMRKELDKVGLTAQHAVDLVMAELKPFEAELR